MPNVIDRIVGDPQVVTEADNSNVQQNIPKDVSAMAFLRFRLTGTLNVTVAATAKLVESIENLIAMLQCVAVGKGPKAISDTLKSVDAPYLYRLTHLLEETTPTRIDVGTAVAAYAFETNLIRFR